jgi:tetratricopeptide (TPR) repeat protein
VSLATPALGAPAPIQSEFPDDQVLLTLPNLSSTQTSDIRTAQQLADQVRTHLQQARSEGDPRFLGYAQRLLQDWPADRMTDSLRVLRATLWQSLHRFDEAREDLNLVLNRDGDTRDHVQALLTLANLEIVQGRYAEALTACKKLEKLYPGLIAASCEAQVLARTGQADSAYTELKALMQQAQGEGNITPMLWAEGTLADIAAQLGLPVAEEHWRNVLAQDPDDLYSRTQLADWLIQKQRFEQAVALTEGYNDVDSLAVLRAIALQATGSGQAKSLVESLDERFTEARWRGNLLHQRDYARFLLDIRRQPDAALTYAQENWQSQREPMDTRLLLRAAGATGNSAVIDTTDEWLASINQRDARYPEIQP